MTIHSQSLQRLDPHLVYGADALVSFTMGVTLAVMADTLTALAAWPMPASFLSTLGFLLLPWAAYNAWIYRKPRPTVAAVRTNIAVDATWIVGSIALGIVHAPSLSPLGMALLGGQAIAVAGVLILKLAGARALVH